MRIRKKGAVMGVETKFDFECLGCHRVHTRSLWSVAHWDVAQVFKCECGLQLFIDPDPTWLSNKTTVRIGEENGREFDELRPQGHQRVVPQGL